MGLIGSIINKFKGEKRYPKLKTDSKDYQYAVKYKYNEHHKFAKENLDRILEERKPKTKVAIVLNRWKKQLYNLPYEERLKKGREIFIKFYQRGLDNGVLSKKALEIMADNVNYSVDGYPIFTWDYTYPLAMKKRDEKDTIPYPLFKSHTNHEISYGRRFPGPPDPQLKDPLGLLEELKKPFNERKYRKVKFFENQLPKYKSLREYVLTKALEKSDAIMTEESSKELLDEGVVCIKKFPEFGVNFWFVTKEYMEKNNLEINEYIPYDLTKSQDAADKRFFFKYYQEDGSYKIISVGEYNSILYNKQEFQAQGVVLLIEREGLALTYNDGEILYNTYKQPIIESDVIVDTFGRVWEKTVMDINGFQLPYSPYSDMQPNNMHLIATKVAETNQDRGLNVVPQEIAIFKRPERPLKHEMLKRLHEEYGIGFYPDNRVNRIEYQPTTKKELQEAISETIADQFKAKVYYHYKYSKGGWITVVDKEATREKYANIKKNGGYDTVTVDGITRKIRIDTTGFFAPKVLKKIELVKPEKRVKQILINASLNAIDTYYVKDFSFLFANIKDNISTLTAHLRVRFLKDVRYLGQISYADLLGDRDEWNVSNGEDFSHMFEGSLFEGELTNWDFSNGKYFTDMFKNSAFKAMDYNWKLPENVKQKFTSSIHQHSIIMENNNTHLYSPRNMRNGLLKENSLGGCGDKEMSAYEEIEKV